MSLLPQQNHANATYEHPNLRRSDDAIRLRREGCAADGGGTDPLVGARRAWCCGQRPGVSAHSRVPQEAGVASHRNTGRSGARSHCVPNAYKRRPALHEQRTKDHLPPTTHGPFDLQRGQSAYDRVLPACREVLWSNAWRRIVDAGEGAALILALDPPYRLRIPRRRRGHRQELRLGRRQGRWRFNLGPVWGWNAPACEDASTTTTSRLSGAARTQ
jgi:hypothetical protein